MTSWADRAKSELRAGRSVQIRPRGHSMKPRVHDGDLVTLVPVAPEDVCVDDIILVRVGGRDYLHLVKAVQGTRFLIGNNRGGTNGWVGGSAIYGRAVAVEH